MAVFPRAALLLVGLAGGCEWGEIPAELRMVVPDDPQTLDPGEITGIAEGRIASALFEGLVRLGPDGRTIRPATAESWDVSPDGLRYRFRLRPTSWSDGRPLTAVDFIASWRRVLASGSTSGYADLLFCLRGARAFRRGEHADILGLRASDPLALEIELERPTPWFLQLLAYTPCLPVPSHAIAKHGDAWIRPEYLVGNGPYRLVDWRIGHRLRLARRADYWNAGAVALGTLDLLIVNSAQTAFLLYESGQADLLTDLPPLVVERLRGRRDLTLAPVLATEFVRFNTTRAPFGDARVRRAFSLALDREALAARILRGGQTPARGLVPPAMPGFRPAPREPRDLERARALLAAAGFPAGRGFPSVAYRYNQGDRNRDVAERLQAQWREVLGVEVALEAQEWKVFLADMGALRYDLCRSSWYADYPEASTFLDIFRQGGGNNRTGWGDARYDGLLDRAAAESDPARRAELQAAAQALLLDGGGGGGDDDQGCPIAPLYHEVQAGLTRPSLQGLEPNSLLHIGLADLFWARP